MKRSLFKWFGYLVLLAGLLLGAVEGFSPALSGSNSFAFSGTMEPTERHARSFYPPELQYEDFRLIKQQAAAFGLDHRLILALIEQESQFSHDAVSERGAVGMMQVMPVTHDEISEKLNLEEYHPAAGNIRAGIYYFAKVHELFRDCSPADQMCLALAAYNAGPARIYDAQELAAYMGDDPTRWSVIKNVLPLLSKRYYSLHRAVWENGEPRSGCFGSYRQTIAYVDNVMRTYEKYLHQ